MWFSTSSEAMYPRWTTFVKTTLQPKVLETRNPKVWKTYLRACMAPTQTKPAARAESLAREALTQGPMVTIKAGLIRDPREKDSFMCGSEDLQPAFFAQNKSYSEIYINSWWATMFEECQGDLRAAKWTECTLLHELIHWTRTRAGATAEIHLDEDEALKIGMSEAGQVFEMWAYGELQCTASNVQTAKSAIASARIQAGWKQTLDWARQRQAAGVDPWRNNLRPVF